MGDLQIISDGALLIHNGIIQDVGTSRRIENLAAARTAREIDATGRIVMPAFVDADVALASSAGNGRNGTSDIRRMSKRVLEERGRSIADELVRYGVLTVGSPTSFATDLQGSLKALRLHRAMNSKPVRVRSIFSPPIPFGEESEAELAKIGQAWLPAVLRKKLASIVEVTTDGNFAGLSRVLAMSAADLGFAIRIHARDGASPAALELAHSAGAVAVVGTIPGSSPAARALGDIGCVNVAPADQIMRGKCHSQRGIIDHGIPVAFGSGYRCPAAFAMNPQYMLHLAGERLGLTPEEAILASTYNAACSLRLSHVTGSLEPGKSADLCLMDVGDYRDLARRAGHHDNILTMRAGRVVWRRSNTAADG